jgi:hypothetical protein
MANFFDYDTPHSHAKRQLVQKFVASVIPRHLKDLSVFEANRFAMRYLDAFAGKGSFGRDDNPAVFSFNDERECQFYNDCKDCKVCKTGTPIIAVAVLLEHMTKLMHKESTQNQLDSIQLTCLNTIEFIFNDSNLDYIKALYLKISSCFQTLNWVETNVDFPSTFEECYKAVEYEGPFLSIQQSIRIYFTFYEFKDLSFLAELQPRTPLFSLIDPFRVADIPMSVVRQLIGNGKLALLNLMVANLDEYVFLSFYLYFCKFIYGH